MKAIRTRFEKGSSSVFFCCCHYFIHVFRYERNSVSATLLDFFVFTRRSYYSASCFNINFPLTSGVHINTVWIFNANSRYVLCSAEEGTLTISMRILSSFQDVLIYFLQTSILMTASWQAYQLIAQYGYLWRLLLKDLNFYTLSCSNRDSIFLLSVPFLGNSCKMAPLDL